jgi:fumarate hydratase subunit alpha
LRIIQAKQITEAVSNLCIKANIHLTEDVLHGLKNGQANEETQLAKSVMDTIIKNAEIAAEENLPICQDTGMAVVFVDIGNEVFIEGDINTAINEGVRHGYKKGYFRNSIVADPINRKNTNDNTPAIIHYNFVHGDKVHVTVAPKGFGSENMSAIKMLNPSDGINGVMDFVVETVKNGGSNPCPPIVVGVGVGGTMEMAALLAKRALLRTLNQRPVSAEAEADRQLVTECNQLKMWQDTEQELLKRINNLNIGPAGFGGKTTALGVHILTYPTHIAGLPVAVNINCHVARHQSEVL